MHFLFWSFRPPVPDIPAKHRGNQWDFNSFDHMTGSLPYTPSRGKHAEFLQNMPWVILCLYIICIVKLCTWGNLLCWCTHFYQKAFLECKDVKADGAFLVNYLKVMCIFFFTFICFPSLMFRDHEWAIDSLGQNYIFGWPVRNWGEFRTVVWKWCFFFFFANLPNYW